jgi:PKHD-type hydroxylase
MFNYQSTSWPFKIDKLENWAFWNHFLSNDECKEIIKIGTEAGLIQATTVNGNLNGYRDSKITWLYPQEKLDWLYKRLTDVVVDLNKNYFGFELFGFIEALQFTHYKEPDGKYKKHIDRNPGIAARKLSISIQLSEPSEYEGGDLLLHYEEDPIILSKEIGKLFMFPSFVLHEVKPVTKGERYSLVAWVTGPQFK